MYSVSANLCDDNSGDYIAHWEGGDFEDYEEAYKRWNSWWPPEDEVRELCREGDELCGRECEYEIQIGLWDEDGNDLHFYNEGVCSSDWDN